MHWRRSVSEPYEELRHSYSPGRYPYRHVPSNLMLYPSLRSCRASTRQLQRRCSAQTVDTLGRQIARCHRGTLLQDRLHTSKLTEALGGGSQTAVMPAAFISGALLARTLYHAGSLRCAHSQLNPCSNVHTQMRS